MKQTITLGIAGIAIILSVIAITSENKQPEAKDITQFEMVKTKKILISDGIEGHYVGIHSRGINFYNSEGKRRMELYMDHETGQPSLSMFSNESKMKSKIVLYDRNANNKEACGILIYDEKGNLVTTLQ